MCRRTFFTVHHRLAKRLKKTTTTPTPIAYNQPKTSKQSLHFLTNIILKKCQVCFFTHHFNNSKH